MMLSIRNSFGGFFFTFVVSHLTVSLALADHPRKITWDDSRSTYKKSIAPLLTKHCSQCHGEAAQEGDLALDTLDPNMEGNSAARWAMVLDKVTMQEMPPKGETPLSKPQISAISDWIKAEMKRTGKHLAHRVEYANGNKVPHDLLFDPKSSAEIDTPTRVRRLSPQIYDSFVQDVGKRATGISQPFSPNLTTTFQDMGAQKIDEPTTQTLLRNALRMVKETTKHKIENGKIVKIGFSSKEYLRLFDEKNPPSDEEVSTALVMHFDRVLRRKPTETELKRFVTLYEKNIKEAGRETGVEYTLAAMYLLPEAIFRWETGQGQPDANGRVRLAPREIAFALAYALSDRRPDGWLIDAAKKGELDTKEGVAKAVQKMLDNPKQNKSRIMRFFREYFQYGQAVDVVKDRKEFPDHEARTLVADTDRLIEYILERDENVLFELLTTNKSFVAYNTAEDTKKKRIEARKKFEQEKKKNPEKYKDKTLKLPGRSTFESYSLKDFPDKQPTELPQDERAGILTQPAWLVAWSKSDDNDAIHRGKWVRERLLGGVVPDIPITVDAQLPNAPHQTLRTRMAVTEEKYCWQCHTFMNRVGLPFEMYDHFGRHRDEELVLDPEATAKNVDKKGKPLGPVMKGIPVDATGGFEHIGDAALTGDVKNAVEMMRKLAKSPYVEQFFIRHAFRYWMGRNETLGDAKSLQEAHQTYRESKGSMNALIVALLTSDSFLYRIQTPAAAENQSASAK